MGESGFAWFAKNNWVLHGFGFQKNGHETAELVSFTVAENNFVINFFLPKRFEKALNGKITDAKTENEIIFSLSAKSVEEVDQ